ncbi:MAG: ATP-binding cassette domain-containing protein [Acidiphilium sp.]|nr:ATP-binding cassette domain-containing protein [Acidiphilium sp.]MDD4934390.1 ATP-binding cassette domain-containing protein [Acidiphilium sp.]
MSDALLSIDKLTKTYTTGSALLASGKTMIRAVDAVSFTIANGETLGLVGESGCGKSTLGRCVTRLLDVSSGSITLAGTDITRQRGAALRETRAGLQMIFQDPYASLNPRRRVRDIVAEPLIVHHRGTRRDIRDNVAALIQAVGLRSEHLDRFPHEFSGGQRQRVGIARALALSPKLIVADEPVSALDVSVQAQIINLLTDLKRERGIAFLFIAHDLGVVRQIADRVAVMYLGNIIELGATEQILAAPAHPYTEALISAVPVADPARAAHKTRIVLAGDPPSPANPPRGCPFHPRCGYATDICKTTKPALEVLNDGRFTACHHPRQG